MKTYDEYIRLPYKMEIIPDMDEGGYTAVFPELPGCLTCGDTLQDIIESAQDAKREWIKAAMESGTNIPEPADYENFKLNIPKSLHKSLSKHAKEEGISVDQYCLYLLTKSDTLYS